MTTELHTNECREIQAETSAGKVCMHVLAALRTDARVMRSATALKDAGFSVSVIDIVDECAHDQENISGISAKHVKISGKFLATRFKRRALLKMMLVFIRSTWLLLRTPADIYHAHDFTALPACYIAARFHRKPLIFDAHELPLSELDVPQRRWLRILLVPILSRMISSCAGGIGAAPYYEQILRERYHIAKVSLLRNFPPYRPARKSDRLHQKLALDPSVRLVLYQGNIQADRRLDIVVRAASFLEDDIVIVMLGKGVEPTISQIDRLIVSEGASDHVKILPPVPYDELLDWTGSADIGLALIPADGTLNMRTSLPNKLFEYFMAGLPVLASSLTAVAPLVTSYDAGCVVDSLTPADLGTAINAMLGDSAGLARMRLHALEAAHSEFCWEKEQSKLICLYRDILKSR